MNGEPWSGYLETLITDNRLVGARDKWRRLELTAGAHAMVQGPVDIADALAGSPRLMLVGTAGSGKTLLLQSIMYDYAYCCLATNATDITAYSLCEQRRIPLYLDLEQASSPLAPETLIQEWFSLWSPGEASFLADKVKRVPEAHLCLVDHPEALTPEEFSIFLQALLQSHPDMALAVAARESDQPLFEKTLAGFQRAQLNDLNEEQVLSYLMSSGDDPCFQLVVPRVVTEQWRRLFTNLRALENWRNVVASSQPPVPSSLDMLNSFCSWFPHLLTEEVQYSLSELAMALARNKGRPLPYANVCGLLGRTSSPAFGKEYLHKLVKAGLLMLTSGRREVDFLAPVLADYFAALGMQRALMNGRSLTSLLQGELDPWQEAVSFLYGLGRYKAAVLAHLLAPNASAGQVRLAVRCVTQWESAERTAPVLRQHVSDASLHPLVAQALVEAGHWEAAQQEYQEALRLQPGRPALLAGLGRVQICLEQRDRATRTFQQLSQLAAPDLRWRIDAALAVQAKGDDGSARNHLMATQAILTEDLAETCYQLSLLAWNRGEEGEALAQARQAADLVPGARFLCHLGRLLQETGETGAAREVLERAALVDMHSAEAHSTLAWFWERQDSPRKALEHYQLALASEPQAAQYSFHVGRLLHASGQFRRAELYLKRAATGDLNSAATWAELGLLCQEAGRWEDAQRYTQKALDLEPQNAAHHHQLGWLLRARGNAMAAERALRQAVQLDAKNAEYHNRLGVLLSEQKRPAQALAEYGIAVQLAPGNMLYLRNLGEVLVQVGREQEAQETFQRALGLWETQRASDPSLLSTMVAADVYQHLGQLLERAGDHQTATRAFHLAAELVPHQVEYRLREGLSYGYLYQHHHMLEVLRRAVQMQPQDPIVHFQLGQAYETMGWPSEALQEYQEAVHLDPQGAPFLKALGHLQLTLDQTDAARTALERAVHADPSDADAHFQLGTSLERLDLWERAWEEYRAAAQLDVERSLYWLAVGRAGRMLGRWNESLAALHTTVTLEPSSPQAEQAQLELAQLQADQGAFVEALNACTQVLRHNPDSAQARLLAGRFSHALGRLTEARHHLEEALRVDPGSVENHEELGLVLEELGEYTDALNEQQAAAVLAPRRVGPWVHSARIANRLERLDEAQSWLQQALALSLNDPAVHLNMAQLREIQGAWHDVLRHAEHALAVRPQDQEALLLTISAHLELGDLEKAATLLMALQEQGDENPAWWTLSGRLLERRQDWGGAKEAYIKALALGADVSVQRRLAALHTQLGEYSEAIHELEQGLNLLAGLKPKEQGHWHLALADAYLALGKRDKAGEQYRAAEAAGLKAEAHLGLGRLYLDEGQPEAAFDELAQAGQLGLKDARWHHTQALAHQRLGDPTAAVESAQQAVALSPHEVHLWHHLGTLYHQQGDLAMAEQAFTEALRYGPRHSASWMGLGTVLDEQGKPQDALQAYQKGVELAPQETAYRVHLGRILLRLGRASEAVAALEPAVKENKTAEALLLYGQALEETNDPLQALSVYDDLLGMEPGNAEAWYRAGRILGQMNQATKGVSYMEKALALAPDASEWWRSLGQLYEQVGNRQEAVDAYRRAKERLDRETYRRVGGLLLWLDRAPEAVEWLQDTLKTHGEHAELRLSLGDAYLATGNAEAALREFRHASALQPNNTTAQIKEVEALISKGDLTAAERLLGQVLTFESTSAQAWLLRGQVYQRTERWNEAQAAMEEAVRLAPKEGRFRYTLAELLSSQGAREQAQAQLREALGDQALTSRILMAIGRLYELLGRHDQALTAYQRVIAASPSAQAYGDLARVQRSLRMLGPATEALNQAISLQPERASWHRELGDILEETGDLEPALNEYRKALALEPNSAQAHYAVASVLDQQGRYEAALTELEATLRLQPHWQVARQRVEAVSAKLNLERGNPRKE